jgi:anti-sigma factor RsiW
MERDDDIARLWRRVREDASGTARREPIDALDLAAYLDGTLDDAAREAVEHRLSVDEAALDMVTACRVSLDRGEELPAWVMARAEALVAAPERTAVRHDRQSLLARLSDYFSNPWRPAVGAVAFGLYAFLCLASFELGRTDGLPGVVPEAGLPAQGSGLFEDDGGFL